MASPLKGRRRGYKTGGRKPGSKNRVTVAMAEMVLGSLRDVGGQEYLADCANHKEAPVRVAYLRLLGSIMAKQIELSTAPGKAIEHKIEGGARPVQVLYRVVTGVSRSPGGEPRPALEEALARG